MYKEKKSSLAIASLVMGIVSVVVFPFHRIAFPIAIVLTLLGIGAIVTGIIAMRRTTVYSLGGRTLAYIGIITGANGLFWMWVYMVFRMIG
jgi:multidrug efflux pump subunit AcrB